MAQVRTHEERRAEQQARVEAAKEAARNRPEPTKSEKVDSLITRIRVNEAQIARLQQRGAELHAELDALSVT